MVPLPYDPAREKDLLSAAHGAVYKYWGTAQRAHAYEALVEAIAHAEQALAALAPYYETADTAFRVHLLGLEGMIQYARDDLERLGRFARTLAKDRAASSPGGHED